MTTKKAVEIGEMLLDIKTRFKQNLEKSKNNWGTDSFGKFIQGQITNLSNEIDWLDLLKNEIASPCKHPKNCFEGGQPTNCGINSLILKSIKIGSKIDLFFYETTTRLILEKT